MLFKDNFYHINKTDLSEKGLLVDIEINPQHEIFDGHFPTQPITPGVVQIEIVKELLSQKLHKKIKLIQIRNCKFLAILDPGINKNVLVSIEIKEIESPGTAITATISDDQQTYLKLSAIYDIVD